VKANKYAKRIWNALAKQEIAFIVAVVDVMEITSIKTTDEFQSALASELSWRAPWLLDTVAWQRAVAR
jgi:hypothetical protein